LGSVTFNLYLITAFFLGDLDTHKPHIFAENSVTLYCDVYLCRSQLSWEKNNTPIEEEGGIVMKPMFVAKASWFSVICGLIVSACAPQVGSDRWFKETPADQIRMHYAYICQTYGFKEGTTGFSECIQKEINDQKQRNAIAQSAQPSAAGAVYAGSGKSGITLVLRETFN